MVMTLEEEIDVWGTLPGNIAHEHFDKQGYKGQTTNSLVSGPHKINLAALSSGCDFWVLSRSIAAEMFSGDVWSPGAELHHQTK